MSLSSRAFAVLIGAWYLSRRLRAKAGERGRAGLFMYELRGSLDNAHPGNFESFHNRAGRYSYDPQCDWYHAISLDILLCWERLVDAALRPLRGWVTVALSSGHRKPSPNPPDPRDLRHRSIIYIDAEPDSIQST
jgi:hypothetical protein